MFVGKHKLVPLSLVETDSKQQPGMQRLRLADPRTL